MSILVNVYRGDIVDLSYRGHIAVVDSTGNILYYCGDPYRDIYIRSCAKPVLAIPIYESGAVDGFGISPKEAAVFASSHSGESFHVEAVKSILRKAGLTTEYLQCGTHPPFARYVAQELKEKGLDPETVHNSCSGKHSGMLITAKYLNEDLNSYYKVEHPVQQRILDVLAEVCEYDREKIILAIDGCGVPVHAMPLFKYAHGIAKLSKPEVFDSKRENTVRRIINSMTEYPEMIAGTNRICTNLMKICKDRLFAKSGADGYYAIGIKGKGIGITVKMEDGNMKMLEPVIIELLKKFDLISEEELKLLKRHYVIENKNCRGEIVGYAKAEFDLIKK